MAPDESPPVEPTWLTVGRVSGYFGGAAFLVVIALSLLDQLGVLGSAPPYRSTAAGQLADEAVFWAGTFAHQRQIVWDIFARDSLLTLAYIAVVAVSLAVLNVVGARRAIAQLAVAC